MKEMKVNFSGLILNRIKIINSVFSELSVPSFFDNPNILIDEENTTSRRITFSIGRQDRISIPLLIILGENSIRLDIYDLVETFEWSKQHIENAEEEIIDFFTQLLSSYILFESYGNPNLKSYIYLFDKNGIVVNEYPLRGILHSFSLQNVNKRFFFPIYPQN